MPPPALLLRPAIVAALVMVIMSLLVGMFYAWAWAIGLLWAGRSPLPISSPRVVPWGGGSVLAALFAIFSVSVGVSATYAAVTGRSSKMTELDIMLVSALINSALLVVVPLILRGTARARPEDFGLAWDRLRRDGTVGFVAFLLIAPIIYGVQLIAVQIWERNEHPIELMILENFTGRVAILAIVSAVFLAPAVEELLFRGLVQGWLTRLLVGKARGPEPLSSGIDEWSEDEPLTDSPKLETRSRPIVRMPNPDAAPEAEIGQVETRLRLLPRISDPVRSALPVLLTSSGFALVHMPQWPAPLAIFLLSLALGAVYQRTGSLVASFVLHAAFNGLSTLALILAALNPAPAGKKVITLPPNAAIGRAHTRDALHHGPPQEKLPRTSWNTEVFSWTQVYMADTVLRSR